MSLFFPRRLALAATLLFLSGCATLEGTFVDVQVPCDGDACLPEPFEQIERGKPNIVVDSVGWVFGIPNRLFLWNWYVENHNISNDTELQLRQYVAVHGLHDTKVRLNQYDPGGEWRRLVENKRVGAGWRYTFGVVSALGYTVFPGRLFGTDYYNPFTNTVNIYSDVPVIAMQEAAYARDVIDRDLPGTYAFSQYIPGVNLVHETITTRNVLDYVASTNDWEGREEAVHILYPRYGGSVGGAIDSYIPGANGLFQIGGFLVGHATGRYETRGWENPNAMPLLGATDTDASPPESNQVTTVTAAAETKAAGTPDVPSEPDVPALATGIDMTDHSEASSDELVSKDSASQIQTVAYEEQAEESEPTMAE